MLYTDMVNNGNKKSKHKDAEMLKKGYKIVTIMDNKPSTYQCQDEFGCKCFLVRTLYHINHLVYH